MKNVFTCSICNNEIYLTDISTSYVTNEKDEKKICYKCCTEIDKQYMRDKEKTILYLSKGQITNWLGTLRFNVLKSKKSLHNIGRTRTDVWFKFEGDVWHGYHIGNYTQVCHCRKTKRSSIW